MSLSQLTSNLNIIQALGDLPNDQDGLSAAQLKAKFDEAANTIKVFLNDTLIVELEATTDGASGADKIGATPIETSGNTVQSILEYLKTQIDAATTGTLPDGSITTVKLASDLQAEFDRVDTFQTLLEQNSYDDYQLWLELYYKGTISQIEAANTKALTFDGFQDKNNVATTNNAFIDTVNKLSKAPNNEISFTTNSGDGTSITSGSLYIAQTFTAECTGAIKSAEIHTYKGGTAADIIVEIRNVSGSNPGSTVLGSGTIFASNVLSDGWSTVVFSTPVSLDKDTKYAIVLRSPSANGTNFPGVRHNTAGNYSGGNHLSSSNSGSTWTSNPSYDLLFKIHSDFSNGDLISKTKNLSFTASKIKAYISMKKPTNTTVTVKGTFNGGTDWVIATEVSNRPDPKFAGYTEYEFDIVGSGTQVAIKAEMQTTDSSVTPEIKRYGLHFE